MALKIRPIVSVFLTALFVLGDARSHHHRRSRELGGYQIRDDYNADNFFQRFDFFTVWSPRAWMKEWKLNVSRNPTQLMVSSSMWLSNEKRNVYTVAEYRYVNESAARYPQLISNSNGKICIRVDYQNVAPAGRASVRVLSKKSYERVLVVADIEHPCDWTLGPNWPNDGELDIIEGVNEQARNKLAFHTGVDCRITGADQTGNLSTSNCNVYDPNQPTNAGCGAEDPQACSYGREFNEAGGGVYTMHWTSNAVRIWFFSRSKIPPDVSLQDPKPEKSLPSRNFFS
ncbi:MAG: hypothetical protein M1816_002467 [Peltula sp. TS41687]|nr:MAG: hypothetical protein M1816_002467 [Peltula sp. TS41687]